MLALMVPMSELLMMALMAPMFLNVSDFAKWMMSLSTMVWWLWVWIPGSSEMVCLTVGTGL